MKGTVTSTEILIWHQGKQKKWLDLYKIFGNWIAPKMCYNQLMGSDIVIILAFFQIRSLHGHNAKKSNLNICKTENEVTKKKFPIFPLMLI